MGYKVLYRKYRPDNFENLIGQDNIVKILKNSIENNKISHAYIFSGPRGTGKTSSAKIFAKSVNCLKEANTVPCNKCINCQNSDTSSDIIEIDAASNNGVDEIREITNNIKLAPNMMKYKVYIIDEVHMLSQSAFNALLLTLEEPPSHVIFILATTNIESVPITILSRCQRFDFKKITQNDIENRIKFICKEEKINITDEAVKEIAYLSDGGMRDSLSLLDQLSKEEKEITLDDVTNSVGNISIQNVNLIIDYLESNDAVKLLDKLEELSNKSVDAKLLIKSLIEQCANRVKKIILNNEYNRLSVSDYKKIIFELTDCMNKINVNVNVYSMLIVLLFNYLSNGNSTKMGVVNVSEKPKETIMATEKIDKSEEKITQEEASTKEETEVTSEINIKIQNKDIRMNNCFVDAVKEEKLKQISLWNELKEEVDNKLKGLIIDSEVVIASKDILTIMVERDSELKLINKKSSDLEDKYNKLNNTNIKLLFLTKLEWEKYSKEYINNLKNGIKYTYKEELVEDDELASIADSIFDTDKIEKG